MNLTNLSLILLLAILTFSIIPDEQKIIQDARLSLNEASTYTEFVSNGDFEASEVGILNPKDNLTGWDLNGDNGGIYSIGVGNYLNMTNADTISDYGNYIQSFDLKYNESHTYSLSGKLRLIIDGTSYSQMATVAYQFRDSFDNLLGRIIFYLREDDQSYTNNSQDIYFNLSPYGANSASWGTNPDTGWVNFERDLSTCFNGLENLNTISERGAIDQIVVYVEEYTSYSEAAQALFDDISFTQEIETDATNTNWIEDCSDLSNWICPTENEFSYPGGTYYQVEVNSDEFTPFNVTAKDNWWIASSTDYNYAGVYRNISDALIRDEWSITMDFDYETTATHYGGIQIFIDNAEKDPMIRLAIIDNTH
ncbi:MAG: hypothetical protein ACXABU_09755, partial [Candidatus Hodarchaeales archaeon]